MNEIIFSIIIPHKNTPDLLQRCLDSIPRRKDVQIIVVDDNSDEDKVDFSHFPCLEDEYVEIYLTKEGKGAGFARNVGMTHAKGKWLLFADADDFFTEEAFDCLYSQKDSQHEIVYFKTTSCFSDTGELANRCDSYNLLIDNFIAQKDGAIEAIRYRWHAPWSKMICREFVKKNGFLFDETIVINDAMFSLFTGYFAQSVGVVNSVVYCITIRKGSLTNRFTPDIMMTRYIVALRYNEFQRKHHISGAYATVVIYYLLTSIRYGSDMFCKCIKLAFQYKMNPFMEITRWIPKYIGFRKDMRQRKGYIMRE
jgi:glycosyltransferase involved in cell wall biosynthesis